MRYWQVDDESARLFHGSQSLLDQEREKVLNYLATSHSTCSTEAEFDEASHAYGLDAHFWELYLRSVNDPNASLKGRARQIAFTTMMLRFSHVWWVLGILIICLACGSMIWVLAIVARAL